MVSIVITAYNVCEWIEKAVSSALGQTHKDLEVIVVEDCSTDNTREVLARIDDERLRIVHNEKNVGAGESRSRGIALAQGEYIMLLDGDDWIDYDFVETLYAKAVEHNAEIVSGGIRIVNADGSWEAVSYGDCVLEGEDKVFRYWGDRIVYLNNKLIHRNLHKKVPYCKRRFIEDTSVIIPMLYYANKVVYVDNVGYCYRMRENSLTHEGSVFKKALFRALCAEDIIRFFEKNDKQYLESHPFAAAYSRCLYEISQCKPTEAMIEPYRKEWTEFSLALLNRIVCG